MSSLPAVRLATDELPRGPWIYARQVASPDDGGDDSARGALVEVLDGSGRFVGHALYNRASDIALRLLSRGRRSDLAQPRAFLQQRLAAADRLRRKCLRLHEGHDAYRIVHAEGDDLSGLVVDRLGKVLVCEYHALGFWRWRDTLAELLLELYPECSVLHTVAASAMGPEAFAEVLEREAWQPDPAREVEIRENGLAFGVLAGGRHKTGWFCDQRANRAALASLARGRTVLDLCTNLGGFALNAARAGAARVRAVDLDEQALERAEAAGRANGLAVEWVHADAFDVLRELERGEPRPELVIVDPHKLVRSRAELEAGLRKYGDLNALALGAVRPGGLLATFSCSGAVELAQFLGMLFGAARRARRDVRLLSTLGAGPDHPQRPDFPRSSYLKGALLAVD
jgi:23S rRNA (cytosine1962-C5)-methyltransferase